MITASCICGESFEVPDSMAGKTETCPACGLDVIVSPPSGKVAAKQAPASPPAQPSAESSPLPASSTALPQSGGPAASPAQLPFLSPAPGNDLCPNLAAALKASPGHRYPGQTAAWILKVVAAAVLAVGVTGAAIGYWSAIKPADAAGGSAAFAPSRLSTALYSTAALVLSLAAAAPIFAFSSIVTNVGRSRLATDRMLALYEADMKDRIL